MLWVRNKIIGKIARLSDGLYAEKLRNRGLWGVFGCINNF